MIILIYGKDNYRVGRAVRTEVLDAKNYENQPVTIVVTDQENDPVSFLDQAFLKRDLFGGVTTVVAKNVVFNPKYVLDFEKLLTEGNIAGRSDTKLIISELNSERELKTSSERLFNFLISKAKKVLVHDILTGADLSEWIVEEAKNRGMSLRSEVARELVIAAGSDSQALSNELDKLANYCLPGQDGQEPIASRDIRTLIVGAPAFNVFDLVDAIAAKNKNRAYELLYVSLRLNNDPIQLLRPIIYQFRNLLMVKDYISSHQSQKGLEKTVKLHPFVLKKTLNQSQSFDMSNLKRLYAHLAEMDISMKSGLVDPAMAFDQLILHL